jgi:hypothetical protein
VTGPGLSLKRGDAADVLDRVRSLLAQRTPPADIERILERDCGIPPLTKCEGEAHGNPHIDHCGVCAPRWGIAGEKLTIR